MADATLANQSSFTFNGSTYMVTSVIVESPQPEIVNMTSQADGASIMRMVKTGAYTSPGRISLEGFGKDDPKSLVDSPGGQAVFSMAGGGQISRYCIIDSARVEGKVGDVFRVSITLMPTDEMAANS